MEHGNENFIERRASAGPFRLSDRQLDRARREFWRCKQREEFKSSETFEIAR
jgi:hypothetical protein